jgi:hypothetical protein
MCSPPFRVSGNIKSSVAAALYQVLDFAGSSVVSSSTAGTEMFTSGLPRMALTSARSVPGVGLDHTGQLHAVQLDAGVPYAGFVNGNDHF